MAKTILLTGISGYVGTLLADRLSKRSDVEKIIGVDYKPLGKMLVGNPKIEFFQTEILHKDAWMKRAEELKVDTVIHLAWHIRPIYGNTQRTWELNVESTDLIAEYVKGHKEVLQFIHFSTVASYGAQKTNTIEHRYTEDEPFRQSQYLYAEEKRIAEEHVHNKVFNTHAQVTIIRPAAITGPFGRAQRHRFGLQSVLSGTVEGSWVYKLIRAMVAIMPATKLWVRQYVHEDDITGLVLSALDNRGKLAQYEVFNGCPAGDVVFPKDMAQMVHKKIVTLPPFLVRVAFWFMWHITRGRVPTGKGAWRSYSYPILVDGSKSTKILEYTYKYTSKEAFTNFEGLYAQYVSQQGK